MGLAATVNEDSSVAVKVNSRTGTFDASLTSSLAMGTGQLQVLHPGFNEKHLVVQNFADAICHSFFSTVACISFGISFS